MLENRYAVADTSGKWSPPIGESELLDYARKGFIKPNTLIREALSGRQYRASQHPAVGAFFRHIAEAAQADKRGQWVAGVAEQPILRPVIAAPCASPTIQITNEASEIARLRKQHRTLILAVPLTVIATLLFVAGITAVNQAAKQRRELAQSQDGLQQIRGMADEPLVKPVEDRSINYASQYVAPAPPPVTSYRSYGYASSAQTQDSQSAPYVPVSSTLADDSPRTVVHLPNQSPRRATATVSGGESAWGHGGKPELQDTPSGQFYVYPDGTRVRSRDAKGYMNLGPR